MHRESIASLTQANLEQQDQLRAQHKLEIDGMRSRHEAALSAKRSSATEAFKKEVEARVEEARLRYEVL